MSQRRNACPTNHRLASWSPARSISYQSYPSAAEVLAHTRSALRRVELAAVIDGILDAAGTLEPRVLRTLDAIHLATALALGDDLDVVVTYDARMAEGARLLGLEALSPG